MIMEITSATMEKLQEIILTNMTTFPIDVAQEPNKAIPKTIHFIAIGMIIPSGLFFNVLSFVVLSTSPILRKSTTGHYLLSLAIADSVFLVGEFLRWLNTPDMHHLGIHIYFMDTNDVMCRLIYVVRYVAKLASAWITVAITIERFITVAFPLKVARISTPKIAKLAIGWIWLSSLIFGLFPLWTVGVAPYPKFPFTACVIPNEQMYNLFNWISLRVGSLLLPGLLMIVFTILIAVFLSRARDARMRKLSTNSATSGMLEACNRASRVEHQLTIMLMAVAVSFVLFRLPYTVTFYVTHYEKALFVHTDAWRSHSIFYALKMTDIFVSVNYASNFFLYCVCGSTFRRQLKRLFKSRDIKGRRDSNMTKMSHMVSSRNTSPYSSIGNQIDMYRVASRSTSPRNSHGSHADMYKLVSLNSSRNSNIGNHVDMSA